MERTWCDIFALCLVEGFRTSLAVSYKVVVVVATLVCIDMAFRTCLRITVLSPVDPMFAGAIADQTFRRLFRRILPTWQESTDLRTKRRCEFWTCDCGAPA